MKALYEENLELRQQLDERNEEKKMQEIWKVRRFVCVHISVYILTIYVVEGGCTHVCVHIIYICVYMYVGM